MSLLYGIKAVYPSAAAGRPHIFGFETPRGAADPLLEVWNDSTGAAKAFQVLPEGIAVPGGTLTGGAHGLVGASHTASGLTTGQPMRATSATAFGFGAVDLANADAVTGALPNANVADLPASKITSGTLALARIPSLPASQITSGEFNPARIPGIDAAKITSGTFADARIPSLAASKITSGTFDVARIPDLAASKVTSGVFDAARIPLITQTLDTKTANYTLVLGDASKCVEMNNASARTITVPPNSSVAFPVGTLIDLGRVGAGSVEVVAGSGVTIQSAAGLFLRSQHSMATLQKRATDTWRLVGDLSAP